MPEIKCKPAFGRPDARRMWISLLLLCVTGAGLQAPAFAQDKDKKEETPKTESSKPLSVGDTTIDQTQAIRAGYGITVVVRGEAEPSDNYIVDAAGNITLKYAGAPIVVRVSGFTPKQAADEINKALKSYIKSPDTNVTIARVPRPNIFVSTLNNALRNTGPIIINTDTTLEDVLGAAGITEQADLTRVLLTRIDKEGKRTRKVINFADYLKPKPGTQPDESLNPVMQNGDRIFVGAKTEQSGGMLGVYGEVLRPQDKINFRTNPPTRVLEAVSLAGGLNQNGDRKHVQVRRAGEEKPIIVDLDLAESGDAANDIALQADDTVYVPRISPTQFFYISGGLARTGRMAYDRPITLTQAIMENGGPIPNAKVADGRIFRRMTPDGDPKKTQVIKFNWRDIEKGKQKDLALLPGDSIWIAPGNPSTTLPWDIFRVLQLATQLSFLYNQINGRGFGFQ